MKKIYIADNTGGFMAGKTALVASKVIKEMKESGYDVTVTNESPIDNSINNIDENQINILRLAHEAKYAAVPKRLENIILEPVRSDLKIGRNEKCPCGSDKKYKKCCLTKTNNNYKNERSKTI